jgi:hypothetical protein
MSRAISVHHTLVWSSLPMLGVWALLGCGGKAQALDVAAAASAGQGGSAGSVGVAALAGTASGGADPGTLALDAVPWFDGSGASEAMYGITQEVVHMVASGTPARSTLSTHNHVALLSGVSAIDFSARGSAPLRLLVSASNAIQSYDYFAAREGGKLWPVAPVDVGVDWHDFSVPLADMMPAEVGDSDGMPSFFIAFIVDAPTPVEVWLDDIRLERVQ